MSRRHGDEDWLLSSIAWAAEFSIALGRWDESLALIDEHDRPGTSAGPARRLRGARLNVLAYRGEAEAAEAIYRELEPLRAELGRAEDLGLPISTGLSSILPRRARQGHLGGIRRGRRSADHPMWSAWFAAGPAFALRDIEAARRIAAVAEGSLDRGRYSARSADTCAVAWPCSRAISKVACGSSARQRGTCACATSAWILRSGCSPSSNWRQRTTRRAPRRPQKRGRSSTGSVPGLSATCLMRPWRLALRRRQRSATPRAATSAPDSVTSPSAG